MIGKVTDYHIIVVTCHLKIFEAYSLFKDGQGKNYEKNKCKNFWEKEGDPQIMKNNMERTVIFTLVNIPGKSGRVWNPLGNRKRGNNHG